MIEISLPIHLQSPNIKEHWQKTYKRNKRITTAVRFSLRTHKNTGRIERMIEKATQVPGSKLKVPISLIRSGPKNLDYDNMVYAFKPITDAVCGFFFPNLAAGRADGLNLFEITYLQEKGPYGIKITINCEDKKKACTDSGSSQL